MRPQGTEHRYPHRPTTGRGDEGRQPREVAVAERPGDAEAALETERRTADPIAQCAVVDHEIDQLTVDAAGVDGPAVGFGRVTDDGELDAGHAGFRRTTGVVGRRRGRIADGTACLRPPESLHRVGGTQHGSPAHDVFGDGAAARGDTVGTRRRRIFGTSEWEDDVFHHVSSHGQVEGEILDEYERLANDDDMSPAFRYLARMILDDEVRHHRIFDDLAATMRAMREHTDGERPIPELTGFHADRFRITRVTEDLLRIERDDLRELKRFSKELKEVRNVNLWSFLIELMIDDTKKHIKILEYIRDRAADQPD